MSARLRTGLRALGRAVMDGLATENGWLWAYGWIGPPSASIPSGYVPYQLRGHTPDPWSSSAPDRSMPTRG